MNRFLKGPRVATLIYCSSISTYLFIIIASLRLNQTRPAHILKILTFILGNQKEDILTAVVEKHTKATNNVKKNPNHQLDEDTRKNLIARYGQESDEDY